MTSLPKLLNVQKTIFQLTLLPQLAEDVFYFHPNTITVKKQYLLLYNCWNISTTRQRLATSKFSIVEQERVFLDLNQTFYSCR